MTLANDGNICVFPLPVLSCLCIYADDKFDCDSFHLEFVTGRRQASRPSHHHVTLPVHAYYLLRLYYFKEVRSQSSLSSDVRAHVPAENWARYYEGRRRFLDDQSTRARHYNREDDDLVARYVRNYVSKTSRLVCLRSTGFVYCSMSSGQRQCIQ